MEVSQEERERLGAATLQIFTPGGKTITRPLNWESHNRLATDVKLTETGCYRGAIQAGGHVYRIPPMSIPVSPEFLMDRGPDFGRKVLAQMAALTGGREVLDLRDLFDRSQKARITTPVIIPFLIAFLTIFLLEVAEPRFGLLHLIKGLRQAIVVRARDWRWGKERSGFGKAQAARKPGRSAARQGRRYAGASQATGVQSSAAEEPTLSEKPVPGTMPGPQPADMDYLGKSKLQSRKTLRIQPKSGEK
jgi:hypothetical protein